VVRIRVTLLEIKVYDYYYESRCHGSELGPGKIGPSFAGNVLIFSSYMYACTLHVCIYTDVCVHVYMLMCVC